MQIYNYAFSIKRITIVFFTLLWVTLQLKAEGTNSYNDKTNYIIDSLKQQLNLALADTTRIDILWKLADIIKFKQPVVGLNYVNQAEQLCKQINDLPRKAHILEVKGILYHVMTDYSRALFYYFQALRLYEATNNHKYISSALNDIATCYSMLQQYELAKKYFTESLQIRIKHNITDKIGESYNNIGLITVYQGNITEGIDYFKKSAEANGRYTVYLNISMGDAYAKLNQLDKSEYYYKNALALLTVDSGNIYNLVNCYKSLGQLYIKKRHFKEAEKYLFLAKNTAETSGVTLTKASIYEVLVELYEAQNDYKNANLYNKQLLILKDTLFKENTIRQISEMQAKYESVKKDQEIESLNKDKEVSREKANKEKILRNSFITAFAFVLIILFILTRNIIHKQKTNKILLSKNELIERQKVEIAHKKQEIEEKNKKLNQFNKELIKDNIYARYEVLKSKVNPHFLFNSLSTLATLILKKPEDAFEFVSRFSQLYRTIIATSDQQLIPLQKEIELVKDYFFLQQIRFDKNLRVIFDIQINEKNLYVPPFALQIVVENVLKHNIISAKTPLDIYISIDNQRIIVTNPIQKRKNVQESTGFGQRNLVERYRLITKEQPVFKQQENIYIANVPVITKTNHTYLHEQVS